MPAPKLDYYAMLGVLRDASPDEIKHAYFVAAHRLHPDKNKAAGETEMFLEVQKAYEVLSSPKRRAAYDTTLPKDETANSQIRFKVDYSRPNLVHLNEPQLLYVLLEVSARKEKDKIPAPPLNLCLVLDRSTSMQGEKIDVVKATATQLMRSLRTQDIFSVVAFSDRAEVIIPAAYQTEQSKLQGRIQMMRTGGATEIFQGLDAGMREIRRSLDANRVNHLILLTDGQTYGDEQACLQLADEAARQNVGISGFGIGADWNDTFLDTLTSRTGSNSAYIAKPQDIQRLLMDKFNALANIVADDVLLEFKTDDSAIKMNYAFRLQPEGGPVPLEQPMHLGPILQDTPLTILFEFVIQPLAAEADWVKLLSGSLKAQMPAHPLPVPPLRLQFDRGAAEEPGDDAPPPSILAALSRLTLYRLQQRAHEEAESGRYEEATRHLRNLASHLLAQGEQELAKTALLEANNMEHMQAVSQENDKEIKYGTRALLLSAMEIPR